MGTLFVNNHEALIHALNCGGVVLCNSDTVPAIICNINSVTAIEKIIKIKGRDSTKTFAIMVNSITMLNDYITLSHAAQGFVREHMPGYFTIIGFAKNLSLNAHVLRDQKIAIRMPKSTFLTTIIESLRSPLVATSANLSGKETAESIAGMSEEFKSNFDLIFHNEDLPVGKCSTIIDVSITPWKLIRDGSGVISENYMGYFL